MSEIKNKDTPEAIRPEKPGSPEIKPEVMSGADARSFWNNHFTSEQVEGRKVYYDDNGKKYRVGDNLETNAKFEVNGYQYETDDQGRTISAEGTLRLRDPEYKRNMDSMDAVGKGDQQDGDHKGHLIGHRFEGSGGIENLVPMNGKLNQGDYAKLETTLADAVEEGAEVRLKVEPVYEGNSNRPSEFRISYSIDGEKDVIVFKNRSDSE